jgi:hypothetical protein
MWTLTTLTQAIQDWSESDEPTFVADIPEIIRKAEDYILHKAQLPDFRKNVTGTVTTSNQYLQIPSDFLAPYSLALNLAAGWKFLLFKEVNFIRAAYPSVTATGNPKHYAIFDEDCFIMGPTPNANYEAELHYFFRPQSIADAASGTSWLGTNAEGALLNTCMYIAYAEYLKGDEDMVQRWMVARDDTIADLKLLAEGRDKTDSHRAS